MTPELAWFFKDYEYANCSPSNARHQLDEEVGKSSGGGTRKTFADLTSGFAERPGLLPRSTVGPVRPVPTEELSRPPSAPLRQRRLLWLVTSLHSGRPVRVLLLRKHGQARPSTRKRPETRLRDADLVWPADRPRSLNAQVPLYIWARQLCA